MKRNLIIGGTALVLLLISIKFFPYHCNCQVRKAISGAASTSPVASSTTLVPANTRTTEIYMGPEVITGTTHILVDVADTEAKREQGLSGRTSLAADHGMLFVFPSPEKPGFWMKDMNFSLDIIWISADQKIIGVEKNLSPSTYPQAYYPSAPVRYTLELPAGTFDREHFYTGEKVTLDI